MVVCLLCVRVVLLGGVEMGVVGITVCELLLGGGKGYWVFFSSGCG